MNPDIKSQEKFGWGICVTVSCFVPRRGFSNWGSIGWEPLWTDGGTKPDCDRRGPGRQQMGHRTESGTGSRNASGSVGQSLGYWRERAKPRTAVKTLGILGVGYKSKA